MHDMQWLVSKRQSNEPPQRMTMARAPHTKLGKVAGGQIKAQFVKLSAFGAIVTQLLPVTVIC